MTVEEASRTDACVLRERQKLEIFLAVHSNDEDYLHGKNDIYSIDVSMRCE